MRGGRSVILFIFVFILFMFSSYACNNDGTCDPNEESDTECADYWDVCQECNSNSCEVSFSNCNICPTACPCTGNTDCLKDGNIFSCQVEPDCDDGVCDYYRPYWENPTSCVRDCDNDRDGYIDNCNTNTESCVGISGVINIDYCLDTPFGETVNERGCSCSDSNVCPSGTLCVERDGDVECVSACPTGNSDYKCLTSTSVTNAVRQNNYACTSATCWLCPSGYEWSGNSCLTTATYHTYYGDGDGDGYGDPTNPSDPIQDTSPPTGYVNDNTDCDDGDSERYPGNTEVCDSKDNDCDGIIDNDVTDCNTNQICNTNGVCETTCTSQTNHECYDNMVNIDNTEIINLFCSDNNYKCFLCDSPFIWIGSTCGCPGDLRQLGTTCQCPNDEPCRNGNTCTGEIIYYQDADGDDYPLDITDTFCEGEQDTNYISIRSDNEWDCNDDSDTGGNINPGVTETCNGIDDNCNDETDEGFNLGNECTAGDGICRTQGVYVCSSDGTSICNAVPNDHLEKSEENCNNNDDDDCDGYTNEGCACTVNENCNITNNYGICYGTATCSNGGILSICNAITPEQEICDGEDNNCNDIIDEGCLDNDGDGYIIAEMTCSDDYLCGDCDDNNDTIHPNANEYCNGIDNDCNANIDDNTIDCQEDGYGCTKGECKIVVPIDCMYEDVEPINLINKFFCQIDSTYRCSFDDENNKFISTNKQACEGNKICNLNDPTTNRDDLCTERCTKDTMCLTIETHTEIDTSLKEIDCICDNLGAKAYECKIEDEMISQDENKYFCETDCIKKNIDKDDFFTDLSCGEKIDCNDEDGEVYPGAPELCDDKDNNCNDVVDEGCDCIAGNVKKCQVPKQFGICKQGEHTCSSKGEWGECVSLREPEVEMCNNNIDDDCDGDVDTLIQVYFKDYDINGYCITKEYDYCQENKENFQGYTVDEFCTDRVDNNCDGKIDCQDNQCKETTYCDITKCTKKPECTQDEDCNSKELGEGECVFTGDTICDGFCHYSAKTILTNDDIEIIDSQLNLTAYLRSKNNMLYIDVQGKPTQNIIVNVSIHKDVIDTASLLEGNFRVIEDDPLIQFKILRLVTKKTLEVKFPRDLTKEDLEKIEISLAYEELEQDDKTVDYRALVKSENGKTTVDLSLFPKSETCFSGLLAS